MGKAKKVGIGVGIGILAFFIFVLSLGFWLVGEEKEELRSLSQEELQDQAISWNYNDIIRNFEYYEDEIIYFKGPIITVDQVSGDRYALQVQVGCKPWPASYDCDDMLVDYDGKRLLEDDRVEVWGKVERLTKLTYVMGNSATVPVITGLKVNCLNCPN